MPQFDRKTLGSISDEELLALELDEDLPIDDWMAVEKERSRREFAVNFCQDLRARIAQTGAPPLGLHILMGVATPQKIGNMVSALEQGLISPTEMICRAT